MPFVASNAVVSYGILYAIEVLSLQIFKYDSNLNRKYKSFKIQDNHIMPVKIY